MKLTKADLDGFLWAMEERGHTPGPWFYGESWKVVSQCETCGLEGHLVEVLHPEGETQIQGPAILNKCVPGRIQ